MHVFWLLRECVTHGDHVPDINGDHSTIITFGEDTYSKGIVLTPVKRMVIYEIEIDFKGFFTLTF